MPVFKVRSLPLAALGLAFTTPALAGPDDFGPGPLIPEYGQIARVDTTTALPDGLTLQIAFDTATRSETDSLNRTLTSAARLLNMHVANGVAAGDIRIAVVIHGGAVHDVTAASAGPNAELVAALQTQGVRVIVCGQSAAYLDVDREDLLAGVEMALSAMTAHALLQQGGYTLNPF
ncbi:DsrE family protein [Maricaulis sp.]|uniref:DsrE family protein n=1 Tax=Maricaulis sp. TaxID=1486257 RepID=UPI0025BF58FD|nr:DsrE family protein [Maricaulis sp.]